jgi:hypothetical protein
MQNRGKVDLTLHPPPPFSLQNVVHQITQIHAHALHSEDPNYGQRKIMMWNKLSK